MTGLAQTEEPALSIDQAEPRRIDRAQAVAAIALMIAVLSLVFGASKANSSDVQDIWAAVDNAATSGDLQQVQGRLQDVEARLTDAEATLARFQTLTLDMAAASKVDAAVQDLQSSIDSLRRQVSDLCDEVSFLNSLGSSIPVTRPPGAC